MYTATNDFEALQDMLGRADTPFSEFLSSISIPIDTSQDSISFEFDDNNLLKDLKIVGSDADVGVVLHLQIKDLTYGHITTTALKAFWPGSTALVNFGSDGKVHINGIQGTKNEQCLFVDFKAGDIGIDQGASWLSPLPKGQEYYYSYEVCFPAGFDFKQSGRLPGIGGGTVTGLNPEWEQAFEWGSNGKVFVNIPGQGQIALQHANNSEFKFSVDTWYTLKARVKLNSAGNSDGIFQLWIDGEQLVDQANISILPSGGDIEWLSVNAFFLLEAADKRCSICFQEFILSTSQIQDQ